MLEIDAFNEAQRAAVVDINKAFFGGLIADGTAQAY
jgi:hypothetical protein